MKKIKLFKFSNWTIDKAEETINKWIDSNNVDIISANTSMGGDYCTTTIVYETKSQYRLDS